MSGDLQVKINIHHRLTFCWPIRWLPRSTSLTGSGSGDPGGPSSTLFCLPSVWTWEVQEPVEEVRIDWGEEEAPGSAGEEDGEVVDVEGAVQSLCSVSCRRVSFSVASSCRSRRTLVSSLVRVSSRCLSWRTSSRALLRSARTWGKKKQDRLNRLNNPNHQESCFRMGHKCVFSRAQVQKSYYKNILLLFWQQQMVSHKVNMNTWILTKLLSSLTELTHIKKSPFSPF